MPQRRDDRQSSIQWGLWLTTDEQTRTSAITFTAIRWVAGLPTLEHREVVSMVAQTGVRGPIEAAEVLLQAARKIRGR